MTTQQLQDAFSGKIYHIAYQETVDLAKDMAVHADGSYPEKLIGDRRPNESEIVQSYRADIWQAITLPEFNKVFASLNKIRRSSEWSIQYPEETTTRIIAGETLQDYLNTDFPKYGSLTNWTFSYLLKKYLVDANSYIVVMPIGEESKGTEYIKPYPYIYRADQVIGIEGDEIIFKSDEKAVYVEKGQNYYGDRYYVVTPEYIQKWDQKTADRKFGLEYQYDHNIGYSPAFKVRSVVKEEIGDIIVNESRLKSMLPRLNEALREYSDLQAEIVQHVYSEKWEMTDADGECTVCKGKKYLDVAGFGSRKDNCGHCGGSGIEPRGPYTTLFVKPPMAGENTTPTPPAGYIQKNTSIAEFQDKNVDKHIYKALSAINMQFLFDRPLAESGIAKAYDADETNNFVHSVAEDIVAVMDEVAFYVNEYRYNVVVPDYNKRQALLPMINVPERFDLFSAKVIEEQLASARTSKLNPVIINALEVDYANKMFSANPGVGERVALIISLDPLAGVSEEDKMVMKSVKGITDETYIISCNISSFIDRAIDEKGDSFYDMERKDQKALMKVYAQEQILQSSAGAQIIDGQFGENPPPTGNTLKESVGGLTGMIEIAKAVASGLYDLDAAVALVSDRFGLTEEEARRQLGTPQIAKNDVEQIVQLT